jgi:putative peptidoglycan lipid II flippase
MSAARPLSRLELLRAMGTVMGAFLLSRALGLLRELIIGQQFGTSGQLDAYLAAFRIPDLLFQLMAGGALASAFIPTFSGFLAQEDERGAWYLMSNVVNALLLLLAGLSVLAGVFAPALVSHVVAPGFPPERQALTAHLMRIMLISPAVFGVSGVLMGVLNSFGRFLLPALAPAAYNLCIILGAWLLGPRMGVQGLALGAVAGAWLHLGVQLPGLSRLRPRYTLALDLHFAGLREVARLMLPRSLGLGIVQLNFLVNTVLASGLAAGSLAALNYAWLLMLLPQGILAQAVGTAVFPTLSALAAQARLDEMRETLADTLRGLLFLAFPASVGLFFLRRPLVEALFQRGAFTVQSTDLVSAALAFYAFGLVAHSALEVIARAFYALHDTLTPVLVGGLAMLVNVVLGVAAVLALRHRPDAHAYLALANTVATTAEAGILLGLLRRRLEGLGGETFSRALLRTVGATAAMGAFLALLPHLAPHLGSLAYLALGAAGGALVYLAAAALMGAREVALLLAWARGRKG